MVRTNQRLFVPTKPDDTLSLQVQNRTLSRWNYGAGPSGSIVQEQVFSGAPSTFTTASLTPVQITGIPGFVIHKQLPGTTLRLKAQFSCFNSGTTGVIFTFYASIGTGAVTGVIGQFHFTVLNTHTTIPQFGFDFLPSVYNNPTNGFINIASAITINLYAQASVNTGTFHVASDDWYYGSIEEVAP